MVFLRTLPSVLACAASLRFALATTTTPIPPSQDPWYTAPAGYESTAPGTVLRVRTAPGNATTIVANVSAAWNILYRTTDSNYNPTFAVTTVFAPEASNASTALVSLQLPYDTADVDASPSYAIYTPVGAGFLQTVLPPLLVHPGWYVSVPDYEGPNASFTAGVISGHATLDSIRAVLSLASSFGLASSNSLAEAIENIPHAMWGDSGGALASEWAAELAVQYAPELNIAGAALGSLTPNVSSVLLAINGQAGAGLAPSAIMGLASQHPAALAAIKATLNPTGPYNASTFLGVTQQPPADVIEEFAFADIGDYFQNGLADILDNPAVVQALDRDGVMGYHGVPTIPILAYKAIHDEISPVADTDKLIDEYCALGANILYERNTVGGHDDEGPNGWPAALTFLAAVLGGTYDTTYNTTGCTIENVSVNITDSGS